HLILVGARAPRIVLAALVGASLGLAGAALQALLRNPLACPHVLGISGGASLFAILATLALPLGVAGGASAAGALAAVPAAAFAGALATAALVQGVAAGSGAPTPTTLLLTGVVFNALAAAIITFVDALVDPQRARGILAWVIGAITVRGLPWAVLAAVTLAAGTLLLLASARDLNALALGEEGAATLGVGVERARRRVYLAVALLVAGAVPVSGMIGFVGLIVPHLVRSFAGGDQRRVVPGALWGGAAFLVAADTIARSLLSTELPVGVVTALCGGPFFLHLLRREGRSALGDAG
ncbi:MAG: FecCD family ABC transporter permease, partial [Alphaproteobacteria bacterium]